MASSASFWLRLWSSTYILYSARKSAKHVLFFISGGIFDQISIALYFIILAPEFERAFGKANCQVLICLMLYE